MCYETDKAEKHGANKNRFISVVPVQNIACFSHICSCLHLTQHKNQMKLIHKMSNNHETLLKFKHPHRRLEPMQKFNRSQKIQNVIRQF